MSSSFKSFLIKDILSKNSQSILTDESNEPEEFLLTKSIDLQQYFNHIKQLLYPITNDYIKNSSLNALLQMTKKTFNNKSDINILNSDVSLKFNYELHRRKRRKNRSAFNAQQIYTLEKRFSHQRYLTPIDRDQIANELHLSGSQVITWFQNRRAKLKRDYEELKNDVNATRKLKTLGEFVNFN